MSYDIYAEQPGGNTRLRHDQFIASLPALAARHGVALVVEDQHRRVVATVSPTGDMTTTPALYQPTR
jgi:L-ribulose-5-phosphate 3-epimerase UlaE